MRKKFLPKYLGCCVVVGVWLPGNLLRNIWRPKLGVGLLSYVRKFLKSMYEWKIFKVGGPYIFRAVICDSITITRIRMINLIRNYYYYLLRLWMLYVYLFIN